MRSDVLILGKLSGYRVAGVYSAAAQITEGCALLPMALMPALLPLLIQWRRAGCAFYRSQCEKIFLGAFVSGLAISFFLATTAPFLIRLAYGAAYSSAAPILVIQAWSAVFLFLSIAQTGYEVTEKLTWLSAARTIAGATLNVLLNFALVPRYGAIGSAVATLVSLGSSACLVNLLIPAGRPIARMQLGALRQIRALREIFRPTFRFPAPQLVNPGSVAR